MDSTLQKAVKILKRHRDLVFQNDRENKPISAIITTLAGNYYNSENSLSDTLINIIERMAELVKSKEHGIEILHPANPLEFLTDKWLEKPEKEETFRRWVNELDDDFRIALKKQ